MRWISSPLLFQICGTVLVPVHHLLDSASTELRNFLLVVILAHIDLNFPRGESTVVDADSGNPAVCVTTLADATPIRHFVHVFRSLSIPWKPQRLSQRLSSSVSVFFFWTQSTEDLNLDVCSPSNSTLTPSMHALSNFGETLPLSPELHLW